MRLTAGAMRVRREFLAQKLFKVTALVQNDVLGNLNKRLSLIIELFKD